MPILEGRLQQLVARGFVAAALSQPGYGNSDGPPDFCGPFSQQAALDALHLLRSQPFAQSEVIRNLALYGNNPLLPGSPLGPVVVFAAVSTGCEQSHDHQWHPVLATSLAGPRSIRSHR